MVMFRGLRVGMVLLSGVLLYATAMETAGAVVLHPVARTVCTVGQTEEQAAVTFPVDLAGTTLRIESVVYYEGAFLEDAGQEEPVVGAMALLVRNTGRKALKTAHITLTGENGTYRFLGRHIPADSRILLLETDGAAWNRDPVFRAEGEATGEGPDLLQLGEVEIRDVDMGTVAVTNRTERTLQNLHLSYKNYLADGDLYQGGICYEETVERLEPGQTVLLTPLRYAMGYSRFVYAQEQ